MLPNFKNPFEVETDASVYSMGAILMQGRRHVCYQFESFHGEFLNYPTYEKELCAPVQAVKKKKNYLMGNDTIININNQLLQYF
jgi:hypothetical protein